MARSAYIYLIFTKSTPERFLSAHTVKYEAHKWLSLSEWDFETAVLKRVKDGTSGDRCPYTEGTMRRKPATVVPWEV